MQEVDLAKIMVLPEVSSIISRFAEAFDSSFSIQAKDGTILLAGETEDHPASYPIECDGAVIGWVSGHKEAALLASRISYAAECEHEKQTLTRRSAQQGGTEAVMKHMEKYYLHFDQAPDVIYTMDTDFRILSISASVKKHLGYLPEELTGKPFPELGLLSEESLARAVTDSMRIFNGEPVVSAEYELIAKDGTIKIAEMRNASIYEDGKVSMIVAVARDVTDKKKAERALELSEMRFRSMAENINDGLIIVEDGKIVYVNDQACRICGYPREELVSLWGPDLTAPGEKEHKDQILQETRTTGVYPTEVDTWMCRKDGTQCCVNLRFSFSYSAERRNTGYVLITDITERKRVEEAMQETLSFLDNIIESSLDPMVIGDPLAHITRVNKAFVQLTGYEQAELSGKHLGELFPPEPGLYQSSTGSAIEIDESFYSTTYEIMAKMIEEGSMSSVEFCYLNKNGLLIPVEQTMFYVYNKSGNRMAVVAICRDISERKKADIKLVEYQKQLRSLASQLTLTEEQERRHIAAALHDRISQSLALAKIKLGALGAELSLQQENANLAAIRSLLDQCIHDTRSLMFDLSPPFLYEFGLQKALEWLLEDIEKQYGIRTRQAWDDAEKNYDDDVRILLYQSIRELLINVVKYAQAKTATVSIHHDDQGVHVRVEDDGKGFPMDQDGFQVSKKGGFGIFSIRERLQHLGGSLKIESGSRCGTKITLDLPLAERAD